MGKADRWVVSSLFLFVCLFVCFGGFFWKVWVGIMVFWELVLFVVVGILGGLLAS